MGLEKIKKASISRNMPHITINEGRFYFNVAFAKMAELGKFSHTKIYCDDSERDIAFEFVTSDQQSNDTYKINGSVEKSFYCQCKKVMDKIWVNSVVRNNGRCSFQATRNAKMWVIKLMPAFENTIQRSSQGNIIPSVSGIYRYLNAQNEIVYIGKGNIRTRLAENSRNDWDFDFIQYSVIDNDDDALRWESYWIGKFKDERGVLPTYNRIMGQRFG